MALATVHGDGIAVLMRERHGLVEICAHTGIRLEVAVDHLLRLGPRNLERRGKPVRLLAIDDAEVHGLGATSQLRGDLLDGNPKDASGGGRVEVGTFVEGRDQVLVTREVREKPQLDLRVVAGEKDRSLGHREGSPHAMPQLRAGGDVLQVGI